MAKQTGRNRMVSSVEDLTDGRCSEAAYIQQRPRLFFALFFGILILVVVIVWLVDAPPVLLGALAGGLPFGLSALTIKSFVLARVDDRVVLARSSRLRAQALLIEWQADAPVDADWRRAIINTTVTFGGQTFTVSPLVLDRAKRILGSGPD